MPGLGRPQWGHAPQQAPTLNQRELSASRVLRQQYWARTRLLPTPKLPLRVIFLRFSTPQLLFEFQASRAYLAHSPDFCALFVFYHPLWLLACLLLPCPLEIVVVLEVYAIMRLRTALSLATLFLACFTLAVWRSPATTRFNVKNPAPEVQSVSGKIASVGDAEFTLELGRNQDPDKLKFLIDSETNLEGELAIGANATVHYRTAAGKNIATRVVVISVSGVRPD